MNDNDDFDDIMDDEDNPFDNPDLTFESEESSYNAGFKLGIENESFDAIDLDRDIEYPAMAFEEKKAFKAGYHDGSRKRVDMTFGDNEEEVDTRPPVYRPEDYNDEGEPVDDEDAEG